MKVDAGLKFFLFLIIFIVSLVFGGAAARSGHLFTAGVIWVGGFLAAWLISSAVRMVAQWQRAVVLRLGKFVGLKGPGLFFIIPLVESVSNVVDTRTISSTFRAEQTIPPIRFRSMSMRCCSGAFSMSKKPYSKFSNTIRAWVGRRKPRCAT